MLGASDLTRAVDAGIVADRLSILSDVVAAAGVNDINQGAELIAAADDVDAVSAAVGLMTVDDLDKGLELARIAGELRILGKIVGKLEMPVLSAVLGDRSERLSEIAIDTILRAAATRSLTELIEATGQRIGEMGEEEIDEGVLRLAASDIAAERSADLSAAGYALGRAGLAELEMAAEDAESGRRTSGPIGVEEVARGAEELGEAAGWQTKRMLFDEEFDERLARVTRSPARCSSPIVASWATGAHRAIRAPTEADHDRARRPVRDQGALCLDRQSFVIGGTANGAARISPHDRRGRHERHTTGCAFPVE